MIENVDGDGDSWEDENGSDKSPEGAEFIKDHQTMPRSCPDEQNNLPRSLKDNNREFLLCHAILDQVLSLEVFKTLD